MTLPAFLRAFVTVENGHWIDPRYADRGKRPRVSTPEGQRNSRIAAWAADGRPEREGRNLRPLCGQPCCIRPSHCGYTVREKRGGVQRMRVANWQALTEARAVLEVHRNLRPQISESLWPRVGRYTIIPRETGYLLSWRTSTRKRLP